MSTIATSSAEDKRIADHVRERYEFLLEHAMRQPGVIREMLLDEPEMKLLGWILRAQRPG